MICSRRLIESTTSDAPCVVDCLGSVCSDWVPMIEKTRHHDTHVTRAVHVHDPGKDLPGTFRLTGRGVCASNPRAIPWDDPATDTTEDPP